MSAISKIVIVQPYVPAYRLRFFEALKDTLSTDGIECLVASTAPNRSVATRGDAVTEDWILPLKEQSIKLFGKSLRLNLAPRPWMDVDAVIMGLEGISVPVHQAMLAKRKTGLRVGLWGHVKPYVTAGNKIDLYLEQRLMKTADRIFAYTPGGAEFATRAGIEPDKVTTVMNTVDTSGLLADLSVVSKPDIDGLVRKHNLLPNRTVCFIGALDSKKRVDFLAEALDHLWKLDSSIKILVGGKGADEHFLTPAVSRGQAVMLGYVKGEKKAAVLRISRAICVPGRVGLVAVDALAAHRPVITTNWRFHAPETEYLIEGQSRYTSDDDPAEYAQTIISYINGGDSTDTFEFPTMQQMVWNFAAGVRTMLHQ